MFIMETYEEKNIKTFGIKLKEARKGSGYTQEQLAEKLMVSRQAVAKWEADKGMPDIENLKLLSKALDVSIDYLLSDTGDIDMSVLRYPICLDDYDYKKSFSGRWVKKTGKKDMAVKAQFPDAEIWMLFGEQICTKSEKVVDNLLGFLTDAPFGVPQFINSVKNLDKEFYLVSQGEKHYFVTVFDDFIESRQLSKKIEDKKFEIGNFRFVNVGKLK
jgi:transcriptional regulator with XRE-family HTH domain